MKIIHVDMDAFYASVEQRDHPELQGQPVIVGGDPDSRGVVSAASYEARKFGVHSAMPCSRAKRLCPQGVFLPVRMDAYADVSDEIHEIFERFTPLIEPISLDEAFLDVTGSESLFGGASEIARKIQADIQAELHLTASVGIAPNKFLAKIGSDLDKPNGFVEIHEGEEQEFLDPLPVDRIWGVGKVSAKVLHQLGIRTIKALRETTPETLGEYFSDDATEHLLSLAHGRDQRPVIPDQQAKSISHENTFSEDICDDEALWAQLIQQCDQVARRLRLSDLYARSVHLKVRFSDFSTITRSHTLGEPTCQTDVIIETAKMIFDSRLPRPLRPVRLIGVGVGHLAEKGTRQKKLFDIDEDEKRSNVDSALDAIRNKFGDDSIERGSSG